MKVKNDKAINKKNILKLLAVIILVIILGYCIVSIVSNTADISRLRAQKEDLDTKYTQQIEDNKRVKAILNSDNKDDYIEQKAREKGYVKDGEVVFYDISSSK